MPLSGVAAMMARMADTTSAPVQPPAASSQPQRRKKRKRQPSASAKVSAKASAKVSASAAAAAEPVAEPVAEAPAPASAGFFKGVQYSPDSTCLLSNSADNVVRLFEAEAAGGLAAPVLQYPHGGTVYDAKWYPRMDSGAPATCCFATTSRAHPVHLWDAFSGALRASYRAVNALDELDSALSLGFSVGGDRLYAGVDRAMYVFEVSRPGAQTEVRRTCATRAAKGGQRGILSCVSCHPDGAGRVAVGSYDGSIAIYSEQNGFHSASVPGFVQRAHPRGVTQVQFSASGTLLYSGGRKDGQVLAWDLRRFEEPCARYGREVATHQRIAFDLDSADQLLLTGSTDGVALVYDIADGSLKAKTQDLGSAVNGASFRPRLDDASRRKFAVSTGQRTVLPPPYDSDDSDDSDDGLNPRNTNKLAVFSL